jgi:hypothetical protein
MQSRFWYTWFRTFQIWVEVSFDGMNISEQTLINPKIQFFEKPNGLVYKLLYRQSSFDDILKIAYSMKMNSSSAQEQKS